MEPGRPSQGLKERWSGSIRADQLLLVRILLFSPIDFSANSMARGSVCISVMRPNWQPTVCTNLLAPKRNQQSASMDHHFAHNRDRLQLLAKPESGDRNSEERDQQLETALVREGAAT